MNRKQDFLEVVVIIAATPATSGDRELIIHALQDIQNDIAYHRKVFRCIILAHARVILAEGYIKAPVQGILNTPVTSGRYIKFNRQCLLNCHGHYNGPHVKTSNEELMVNNRS